MYLPSNARSGEAAAVCLVYERAARVGPHSGLFRKRKLDDIMPSGGWNFEEFRVKKKILQEKS